MKACFFATCLLNGELFYSNASSHKEHFIALTYQSYWNREDIQEKIRKDWPNIEDVIVTRMFFPDVLDAVHYCKKHGIVIL